MTIVSYISHGMHIRENRPKKGGICVANHTSPIDIVILANDGCYAMVSHADYISCVTLCVFRGSQVSLTQFHCPQVGQVHGGLLGVIQRSIVRSCPHVWFERSEMKDRHAVAKRWQSVCRSVLWSITCPRLGHKTSILLFLQVARPYCW